MVALRITFDKEKIQHIFSIAHARGYYVTPKFKYFQLRCRHSPFVCVGDALRITDQIAVNDPTKFLFEVELFELKDFT